MTEAVRRIEACRLCGAHDLRPYVDFGEVPLGNNLQEDIEEARAAARYPLDLARCGVCKHFQLRHAVASELLYATNYTYLSGVGDSFVRHFDAYADWAIDRCGLETGGLVVDVGSNDGTCLAAFQARGMRVCGVDPASLAAGIANDRGIETLNTFFDSAAVGQILASHGQADLVTSHNVLAHVDDLATTFRAVYALVREGGWFAFEVGYFREVLRTGCFDTIYHEHLDYHHAAPLVRHLTALGFDVVDVSVNAIQGGSIRLLLRKTGAGTVSPLAAAFLAEERGSVLYDEAFLADWKRMIEDTMIAFHTAVRERTARGELVAGYGAPTKIVLLLQTAGLDTNEIPFVVEDNPHKVGRFLPGSGIAIRPTSDLAVSGIKVVVLFAWNFADDIIAKLRGRGVHAEVITPLPQLKIETL